MAVEYPKSYFYGVDIAAMFDSQVKLENTEFSLANVLTGLPFPDNSFDFIHMRFFMAALRRNEWPVAIKEAYRLLKPGGGLQLCELFPIVSLWNSTDSFGIYIFIYLSQN
jgi:ubiquinone/menaquinone biosynthesis C-methylase UbiE